jgi:DNA repair protein RadD
MQLRNYQVRALQQLYDWFAKNSKGNPVLNMPGGSGKSVVIASLAKDALQNWPETRVLMLVRSKELVQQNSAKLRQVWPNAPMGIVSASLNKKQYGEPITYASIDSVAKRAGLIGWIDLCLIDEAHMCSPSEEGNYRRLLFDLLAINPNMRVVGFSASPYRLGHGMINEGDTAIFHEILEPVSIEELVYHGHLVPLRSKVTKHKLEAHGLHKRGGDYIQSEMEAAYNTIDHNTALVSETLRLAENCKHWLIFASGKDHARQLAEEFNAQGIAADWLATPVSNTDRERKLSDFESGKIRALVNVGILTTGYDFPALDCIVFARSTMSPGLYLQMAVRGMRPALNKQDCLVLDFAGVVRQHGPITAIQPPKQKGEGNGEAPVKVCDECGELVHISVMVCPACQTPFPPPQKASLELRNDDIMGLDADKLSVTSWKWRKHTSRTSGKDMLAVTYYGALSDPSVTEYFPVTHEGYAGRKALDAVVGIAGKAGASFEPEDGLEQWADRLNVATPPNEIEYRRDGKYHRVTRRTWA